LWILFHGGKHIRVLASHLAWHGATAWNIVRTSLGGIGQMIIGMTSWIFLVRILASLGAEAVAGATIALRTLMFVMMPAWGMSNAAATLVGQNLGAAQPERAEASVWHIGWYNMAYLLGVSLLFFLFHDDIIALFSSDARVIEVGGQWLRIISYSMFVYGWWMVSVQAFNGAGDAAAPTWINLVFFWMLQSPLAWWLARPLDWGSEGVFWAVCVSETAGGLFTLWLFSRGRWKTAQVEGPASHTPSRPCVRPGTSPWPRPGPRRAAPARSSPALRTAAAATRGTGRRPPWQGPMRAVVERWSRSAIP